MLQRRVEVQIHGPLYRLQVAKAREVAQLRAARDRDVAHDPLQLFEAVKLARLRLGNDVHAAVDNLDLLEGEPRRLVVQRILQLKLEVGKTAPLVDEGADALLEVVWFLVDVAQELFGELVEGVERIVPAATKATHHGRDLHAFFWRARVRLFCGCFATRMQSLAQRGYGRQTTPTITQQPAAVYGFEPVRLLGTVLPV